MQIKFINIILKIFNMKNEIISYTKISIYNKNEIIKKNCKSFIRIKNLLLINRKSLIHF